MKLKHPDTVLLNALINIIEDSGRGTNCDFDEMLWCYRHKVKNDKTAYRRALRQWIKNGRV